MLDTNIFIQILFFILAIGGIFYSIILHEIAHGYMAKILGDDTAQVMGRLSLNPLAHIDIYGTIILPILLFFLNLPVFGWAKPVPVNPSKMENPQFDYFTTSLAGPIANFLIACVLGLSVRFIHFGPEITALLLLLTKINLVLMIFNLLPIPPLDGSKFLSLILPYRIYAIIEQFGIYILFALIIFSSSFPIIPFIINRVVGFFFVLLTGQPFNLQM